MATSGGAEVGVTIRDCTARRAEYHSTIPSDALHTVFLDDNGDQCSLTHACCNEGRPGQKPYIYPYAAGCISNTLIPALCLHSMTCALLSCLSAHNESPAPKFATTSVSPCYNDIHNRTSTVNARVSCVLNECLPQSQHYPQFLTTQM